jgi:hypothetical protein
MQRPKGFTRLISLWQVIVSIGFDGYFLRTLIERKLL